MPSFRIQVRRLLRSNPIVYRLAGLAYANLRFAWNFARQGIWTGYFAVATGKSGRRAGQRPLEWEIEGAGFANFEELIALARSHGVPCVEGRHTLYFPPGRALRAWIPDIARYYPDDAGFKVLKDFRPPHEAEYLIGAAGARWRQKVLGPPWHQMTAANLLFWLGVGPRVYDVCMWRSAQASCTSFVVQHIDGVEPATQECEAFLDELREQCSSNSLKILVTDADRASDFRCPDCNGNVIRGGDGRVRYVDFQNFVVWPPSAWRERAVRDAAANTHFGLEHKVRGGRYLYQSVPATGDRGKRDTDRRWHYLERVLGEHDISLERRLVLDVGCNAGMMLHSALARGAHWGLGWDRSAVIPHSEQLLLSLGTSRFSLFGRDLHADYDLEADIPPWLMPHVPGSVLFYLSVRQHIGLLQSLASLPWRVLVYEGHQRESVNDIELVFARMLQCGVRIAARTYLADGDSARRPLAVLTRDSPVQMQAERRSDA